MVTAVNNIADTRRFNVAKIQHPTYLADAINWRKWRATKEGGDYYLDTYLYKYQDEEEEEFSKRKKISYIPAFAKMGVLEVRNSIYQRMADIIRTGGSSDYQTTIQGKNHGVDFLGSSMNTFMGVKVLEEMLFMQKVGIYVDMPVKRGNTVADNFGIRPYLYIYKVEDILSWTFDEKPGPNQFLSLLLRDWVMDYDHELMLPIGMVSRYRYYWIDPNDGYVYARFFDENSNEIDLETGETVPDSTIRLNIKRIPFVYLDMGTSLLNDVANHQIALANLASSDMQYCIGANFPFYTEQYDPKSVATHLKGAFEDEVDEDTGEKKVTVGTKRGRRYPKDTDRPEFISPPTEPLQASMEKQSQIKGEIRMLLNLALSSLATKMASAESKSADQLPLESGLSYIGLLLEDGERQISEIWTLYENNNENKGKTPTIKYPTAYSLKTDEERFKEVDELNKLKASVPSNTFKKEVGKQIVHVMFRHKVDSTVISKIEKEIDAAEIPVINEMLIEKHVTIGILAPDDAATAMGYPEGTVEKAQEYQAKRLELIRKSQAPGEGAGAQENENDMNSGARGVDDESVDPKGEAAAEKEKAKLEGKPTRGPGKDNNQ